MRSLDPYWLGAVEARRMMEAGQLARDAVLRSCRERVEALEPAVRAFAFLPEWMDLPGAEAKGPLWGLPLGIKDIIETHDMPTSYGSPIYAGHRPMRDAFVVSAIRRAGGVIVGKTETTEFAGPQPAPTRNPWDPSATPGGSSAGSAAAVAVGMVPLALGTQTAGSVIRPAAYCGVVGFKPTLGVIDLCGIRPACASLDTVGVFARCVEDAALLASVLAWDSSLAIEPDRSFAPRLALWISPDLDQASPAAQSALQDACAIVARAGMPLLDWTRTDVLDSASRNARTVLEAQTARSTQFEAIVYPRQLSAELTAVVERGYQVPAREVARALLALSEASAELDAAMEAAGVEILLTPAAPDEAPASLSHTGDPIFNRVWTALGMPAITLPQTLGPRGLPIGLQLVGRRGRDAELLAGARAVQDAFARHYGEARVGFDPPRCMGPSWNDSVANRQKQ